MPETQDAERALTAADEAFGAGDLDGVIAHVSAAIRGFTAAAEPCRAAMACVRLGDVYANFLGNQTVGRAWYTRARRLVDDQPDCIEQGYVAIAAMGCDVDDPAELLAAAELALDRARRFGDVNLETKALADAGLAHVQSGRVPEGMALLDEAMALVCGPADDLGVAAKSVCSFFTACYHSADFGRVGSWADPLRRHGVIGPARGGPIFLSSHCDSVQAALLVELGRWGEAEALLERARAAFAALMDGASWHTDLALADLRTRQGRFADAEQLLLGKDQVISALLPAANLHLARGDHELARAAARRGLRVLRGDRLRAIELLVVLVDAETARGDLEAADVAAAELVERLTDVTQPALAARAASARARLLAARDDVDAAVEVLEEALAELDPEQLPWRRAAVLRDLARWRERAGDAAGAAADAAAAANLLAGLDVGAPPTTTPAPADRAATLRRDGRWWSVSLGATTVRLPDTKGLRYVADLVAHAGAERHALDLVDRVEGVEPEGGVDRRALGDAGPALDGKARTTYRRRIEELRSDVDDALEAGRLEAAESLQSELDALVHQLAQAFGLGGSDRRAASAAERARLNVTRALRAATSKLAEALPDAGAALDRGIQTGLYSAYRPGAGDIRWIVQS